MEERKGEFAGWRALLTALGVIGLVSTPIVLTKTGAIAVAQAWIADFGSSAKHSEQGSKIAISVASQVEPAKPAYSFNSRTLACRSLHSIERYRRFVRTPTINDPSESEALQRWLRDEAILQYQRRLVSEDGRKCIWLLTTDIVYIYATDKRKNANCVSRKDQMGCYWVDADSLVPR